MQTTNPELGLAFDYVCDTGCHVFLTGKAGTGKTTFLHNLKKNGPKRMVVTAPTGVAAINAGGVTLHSFFQLPFGPYVPGTETSNSQYRFSRDKISIITNLDLLVIDEISMVRADLLDGVDSVLRRHRRNDRPFGGVQLLMIGDLFQLPPVVKDEEWRLLEGYYASPYFFSSTALAKTEMVTVELQHIYRQVDSHFIRLLNRVRNQGLDPATIDELNRRHRPDVVPSDQDGTIALCTHNRHADAINRAKLAALPQKVRTFKAHIEGDFPEPAYPSASTLQLKLGAQVMFIRNDPSSEKRYFNGKIGVISRFADKAIHIRCPDDSEEVVVEPAVWENIDYKLDQESLTITENRIGTFKQYPLRLAWAITIHKSQGLTFDRAVIDAQAAFAHGQVYVALSRCRTLDGIVLATPLSSRAIRTDDAVRRFSQEATRNPPSAAHLAAEKIRYQQRLLLECFDFQPLSGLLRRLVAILAANPGLTRQAGLEALRQAQKKSEVEIVSVGESFLQQLRGLFPPASLPADDRVIVERIGKAATYFQDRITEVLAKSIPDLQLDTENKTLRKQAGHALKSLQEAIAAKLAAVQSCQEGFSPSRYFQALSAAAMGSPKTAPKPHAQAYAEADMAHNELYQTLTAWRSRKAGEEGLDPYRVLHQKTLIQIAVHLPDTLSALKQVKGIGDRLASRYGEELVALVGAYCLQNRPAAATATASMAPGPASDRPKAARIDTKRTSLDLFEKGASPAQIAQQRELTLSTIEGHLAYFVERGQLAIDALLTTDRQSSIEAVISRMLGQPLGAIKQALGPDVSYGEIRLVQAHLKYRAGADN